ncbi:MAG TPA: hypothetical protein P5328_01525 [Candidatus Paceibacterota bacterium]|nr:hypothetical protein [Candidatus Paceibacterota bacterium]HRZ34684.1 hypothetical protein [Candidatus Paceibacterota bacterium]
MKHHHDAAGQMNLGLCVDEAPRSLAEISEQPVEPAKTESLPPQPETSLVTPSQWAPREEAKCWRCGGGNSPSLCAECRAELSSEENRKLFHKPLQARTRRLPMALPGDPETEKSETAGAKAKQKEPCCICRTSNDPTKVCDKHDRQIRAGKKGKKNQFFRSLEAVSA